MDNVLGYILIGIIFIGIITLLVFEIRKIRYIRGYGLIISGHVIRTEKKDIGDGLTQVPIIEFIHPESGKKKVLTSHYISFRTRKIGNSVKVRYIKKDGKEYADVIQVERFMIVVYCSLLLILILGILFLYLI